MTGQKIKDVDVQNNGKFVIGPETLLKRYTGPPYLYQCLGGKLKRMPQELMNWACKTKDVTKQQRNYESNIITTMKLQTTNAVLFLIKSLISTESFLTRIAIG